MVHVPHLRVAEELGSVGIELRVGGEWWLSTDQWTLEDAKFWLHLPVMEHPTHSIFVSVFLFSFVNGF